MTSFPIIDIMNLKYSYYCNLLWLNELKNTRKSENFCYIYKIHIKKSMTDNKKKQRITVNLPHQKLHIPNHLLSHFWSTTLTLKFQWS